MNLVTLSGYIRKIYPIKRTCKDEDSLTFILEVADGKRVLKIYCVVYNRLVRRVAKAVSIDDKVLIHGRLSVAYKTGGVAVNVLELELLDFIRIVDKVRNNCDKTRQGLIEEQLKRLGI